MPRKKEVVKIDDKEFTIKELTVGEIIDIAQGSVFFNGPLKDEDIGDKKSKKDKKKNENSDISDEIHSIRSDLDRIMATCCDFNTRDLVNLTPSQIREVYEGFKRVNSDFLSSLKAMGVAQALMEIRDVALNRFSKTLVISLKQDM